MTKEQLEALNAAIVYFDRHPARSAAFNLARALERLRDAEAKPVEESADERYWAQVHEPKQDIGPTQRAYDLFFRTTRRLQMGLEAWNEWAENLTQTKGNDADEQRAEIARLVGVARGWAGKLPKPDGPGIGVYPPWGAFPALDAAQEKAKAEAELQEQNEEWGSWAATLADVDENDPEARDEIERLVELGRKAEDTEAKLRVCSEQFDAAMSDWGKAAELLGRIVKCADCDWENAERLIAEAREMLRPAVPIKEPEAGELETMLTALMGPAVSTALAWTWYSDRIDFPDGRHQNCVTSRYVKTPTEALQAINAHLAELAPKGWRVTVELIDDAWVVRYKNEPTTGKLDQFVDRVLPVNSDLGVRITEVLKWIAEREKLEAEPAHDEPIKPPDGWVEDPCHPTFGSARWRVAGILHRGQEPHHHVTVWRDGTVIMRLPDGRVPEWLPQLQARARQVFGGAK